MSLLDVYLDINLQVNKHKITKSFPDFIGFQYFNSYHILFSKSIKSKTSERRLL